MLDARVGERHDRAGRLAVAAHPLVVAALVVLVANDRVLKTWSGGLDSRLGVAARTVTGKASDVAGVLLLTVVVGLLLRHRRAAVVLVGLGFVALKLSPTVADLAVPVLGGRTRTDPWDLLALVALVPADRLLRRVDDRPPPDLRPAWASLRATLGLAVVVASVPAMTATSCGDTETWGGLDTIAVDEDGSLLVAESYQGRRYDDVEPWRRQHVRERFTTAERMRGDRDVAWFRSTDGGRSWAPAEIDRDETRRLLDRPRTTSDCAGETCWAFAREGDPTRIAETGPGGDHQISVLSDGTREAIAASTERGDCADQHHLLGNEVVAVDGGAVATAGSYGVTLLRPGGGWELVPVDTFAPPDDLPPAWPRHLRPAPGVGAVVFVLALVAHGIRWPRRQAVRWFAVALAGAAFLPAYFLNNIGGGSTPNEDGTRAFWSTMAVVGLGLLPVVVSAIWAGLQDRRRRRGPAPGASPPPAPPPPAAGR